MNTGILINRQAGHALMHDPDDLARAVSDHLATDGTDRATIETVVAEPGTVRDALTHLAGRCDRLYVGGGDGTIAAAASILKDTDVTLAVLPFGTMNLVSRDLGLPTWSEGGLTRLIRGRDRQIDTADVNGVLFLHSAVMGLFADLAREREELRKAGTVVGWPTFLTAATNRFLDAGTMDMTVTNEGTVRRLASSSVLVANNQIVDRPRLGLSRNRLDQGRLYLYLPRDRSPLETAGTLLRFAFGRWNANPRLKSYSATHLAIDTDTDKIAVSVDGEVHELRAPLTFTISPRSLKVRVPAQ